jgi:hypothetical protein
VPHGVSSPSPSLSVENLDSPKSDTFTHSVSFELYNKFSGCKMNQLENNRGQRSERNTKMKGENEPVPLSPCGLRTYHAENQQQTKCGAWQYELHFL